MTIAANEKSPNDEPVKMEFRPVAEIGASAKLTRGPDGEVAIQVVGAEKPSVAEIIVTESPKVTSFRYVVKGKVKYDDVVGDAYLELWNDFGEKGQFFSRSLADWGGMKKITGSSNWRTFELPFTAEQGMIPTKLFLNVVLPGKGTVVITEPTIVSLPAGGAWWSALQSETYGGIAGTLFGLMLAAIGVTAGLHKIRFLLVPFHILGLVIGAGALIVGIVAVSIGQPYHVYFPFVFFGLLSLITLPAVFWLTNRIRREVEVRQMEAIDALRL